MPSYKTSSGERIDKKEIDKRVRKAKEQKIGEFIDEHGYIFCEECGINAHQGIPIDCSHTISVKECQESGRTELAWDINNIRMLCRKCHQDHDKLNLKR